MIYSFKSGTILVILLVFLLGCNGTGGSEVNPLVPDNGSPKRQVMDFETPQTIFGSENVAAEVDLASVVWGMGHQSTACGDIVVFDDDTSWVAAIGIEQSGIPLTPSKPVIRFLRNYGYDTGFSDEFYITPDPFVPYYVCRFPRIDCTYLGNGTTEVTVVFRYGEDSDIWANWVDTWDLQLHRMFFRYTLLSGWQLITSEVITSGEMEDVYTGQTHPDIAYDQATGDLYCAWTEYAGATSYESVDITKLRIMRVFS